MFDLTGFGCPERNELVKATDPYVMLEAIVNIDERAAVRLANVWGGANPPSALHAEAAWKLVKEQTAYAICVYCCWAVLEDEPHLDCHAAQYDAWAHQLGEDFVDNYVDEEDQLDTDDEDDECPGGCGQPAGLSCTCAELKSWREHQANPATAGSWWTP